MITLTITNVEEVLFHGSAKSVIVPGSEGEMTILPNHMSLVSGLKNGSVIVKDESKISEFKIEKGVIKVSPEEVLILV
ncbi:MAG: F0F1 ATP synthase subunit epsilon [Patescibacteria group bacterium]